MVLQYATHSGTKMEWQLMKCILQGLTKAEWKPYAIQEKWIYGVKKYHSHTSFCSALGSPKVSPHSVLNTE